MASCAVKNFDDAFDYDGDYGGSLQPGETLVSSAWTVPSSLMKVSSQWTPQGKVKVTLGEGERGKMHEIGSVAVTSTGRRLAGKFYIYVRA